MIGVILVKGISKRLPGKNFMEFNQTMMWKVNYDKMLMLGIPTKIITDSHSDDAVSFYCDNRIQRPDWIGDRTEDVLGWLRESIPIEEPILLMQATNPLVDLEFIETAIHVYNESDISKLVSINPVTCKRDGSVYITDSEELYSGRDMWVICRGEINPMACDIDVWPDYCIARAISEGRVINIENRN